jgi:DNA-binding MarR family transcriptional regulator
MSHERASGIARGGDSPVVRHSSEHLRELFHRKTTAGERHRATIARVLGMDDTEAAALAHLAQHGQLTPGQLGQLLGLTSGGTTALIHRLLNAGHVVRHPHPSDKRSSILTASGSILERAEELYAPLVDEMNALSERLSESERAAVGRYLEDVVELFERRAEAVQEVPGPDQREIVQMPARRLWA